jgi:hypothetical protein
MAIQLTVDSDDFEREMVEQMRLHLNYVRGDIKILESRPQPLPAYSQHDLEQDKRLEASLVQVIEYFGQKAP